MSVNHQTVPLTAVTAFFGGYNELRHQAFLKTMKTIDETQDYLPSRWLFIEMLENGRKPFVQSPLDIPRWGTYMAVHGEYRNRNLFQKEPIWNLGAKMSSTEKMVFLDADFYPVNDSDWFLKITEALDEPHVIVHPVGAVEYDGNKDRNGRNQWFMSCWLDRSSHPELHLSSDTFPGLGIAIGKSDLEPYGFPVLGISGSGDVITWAERTDYRYMFPDERLKNAYVRKGLPKLKVRTVDIVARHEYHGSLADRSYKFSREVLSLIVLPDVLTCIDQNGLLAWKDPDCILADMLGHKNRMRTRDELLEFLHETAVERLRRFCKC